MSAIEAISDEDLEHGVSLDIEPLLEPYLQQGKISVRIERLPPRARLSRGRNNGDGTYSLRSDELQGIVFVPPEDRDGTAVTLAVRVVKLDGDFASTLAVLDLPALPGTEPERPKRSASEPLEPPAVVNDTPPEPAALTAEAMANGRRKFAGMPAKEHVEFKKLQRAFDVLSKSLAETEARAEHAERKVEEAEARLAGIELGAGDGDIDVDGIRAEVAEKYEEELAELRKQLDTAARDLEKAHKQALENANASNAKQFDKAVAAAEKQLTKQFDGRLKQAVREAEETAKAELNKQRQAWEAESQATLSAARENWKREEEQRRGAARKAFDAELSDVRDRFSAATDDIEAARKKAMELAEANHAREIENLKAAHAQALEKNSAATKAKLERAFEDRLASERRESEQAAKDALAEAAKKRQTDAEVALAEAKEAWRLEEEKRLAEASTAHEFELSELRRQLDGVTEENARLRAQASNDTAAALADADKKRQADVESALAAAKEAWRLEEEKRLAAATMAHEAELSQLRQRLDGASEEIAKLRLTTSSDADPDHAKQIEALERSHASDLEARVAAARKQVEDQYSEHLAKAAAHETELADVRAQLETATAEIESLRQLAAAGDGSVATPEQLDKAFEARLAAERIAWKAEAEAELAKARANWKKAEEKHIAQAMRDTRVEHKPKRNRSRDRLVSSRWSLGDLIPRRARVIQVAIVGLVALAVLHPDVRFLVRQYTAPAVAEIKRQTAPLVTRIEPLLGLEPGAGEALQGAVPGPAGDRAVVGVESANVRSGPSTAAGVVGSLVRGSSVTLLRSQGNWRQVRFGAGEDQVGWIYQGLLSSHAR